MRFFSSDPLLGAFPGIIDVTASAVTSKGVVMRRVAEMARVAAFRDLQRTGSTARGFHVTALALKAFVPSFERKACLSPMLEKPEPPAIWIVATLAVVSQPPLVRIDGRMARHAAGFRLTVALCDMAVFTRRELM